MAYCLQCLKEPIRMAFQTHDELDIHAFRQRKLYPREDDSIYIFIYIEAQPIDSDSEQI